MLVGVIIYGSDQEVAELMRAVAGHNATGYFTWIGSDGWSARSLVSQGGYQYYLVSQGWYLLNRVSIGGYQFLYL